MVFHDGVVLATAFCRAYNTIIILKEYGVIA